MKTSKNDQAVLSRTLFSDHLHRRSMNATSFPPFSIPISFFIHPPTLPLPSSLSLTSSHPPSLPFSLSPIFPPSFSLSPAFFSPYVFPPLIHIFLTVPICGLPHTILCSGRRVHELVARQSRRDRRKNLSGRWGVRPEPTTMVSMRRGVVELSRY